MSVDRAIEELSETLTQLGVLIKHINKQIIGITSRINLTLDNFDHSVTGIALDVNKISGKVSNTITQVFYFYNNKILDSTCVDLLFVIYYFNNSISIVMHFNYNKSCSENSQNF